MACWAQQAAPPTRLKLNIIAGQGAVNNIGMRVAAQPGVEVLDEKNAPVVGAEVIFQAPVDGPTVVAYGGSQAQTVKTNAKGQAQATGFLPNAQVGPFRILVRVTAGNDIVEGVINQSNGQGPKGTKVTANKKVIWIVAGVAAAAIAGGVAATRGGDSAAAAAASKKPVSIGAGPITVGGPR
ncbi:MAG: hypothetical protein NTV52_25505 [Acidobacteria bacterium]|nr:hypothetical protein [Acidobacteriota bacterium]